MLKSSSAVKLTTYAKIRIWLAVLCASLLLTAIILRITYTPRADFVTNARQLENNLHKRETIVQDLFSGKNFEALKNMPDNDRAALRQIDYITLQNRIWLVTYKKSKVAYWTGIKIIAENPKPYKEGSQFITTSNGYYEAVRKTEGDFTAIAFIFIKSNYSFQNQYLQNNFEPGLSLATNIDVAAISDKDVYHINNISKNYLFAVKINPAKENYSSLGWEIAAWVAALIAFCLLISSICNYFIYKKQTLLAFGVMIGCIVFVRFINLYFNLPDFTHTTELFNPKLFTLNPVFPTFGDFCLNLLFCLWLAIYIYSHRFKIVTKQLSNKTGYAVLIGSIVLLIAVSTGFLLLFRQLVINSNVSFDVKNVLNLSGYSILGVAMACFSFLIFYFLVETLLVITNSINIASKVKLAFFVSAILITTAVSFVFNGTLYYVLWALLVLVRVYAIRKLNGEITAISYVGMIFICALIAAVKLGDFESIKEKEVRKQLVSQLDNGDNSRIIKIFKKVEQQIIEDPELLQYFKRNEHNEGYLKNRFAKRYFDGYLTDYDCKVYEFDGSGNPLVQGGDYALNDFKDMVIFSSFKVSDYFYRESENFGFQSYFAIIPVYDKDNNIGTVIIELRSKPVHANSNFPELLIENQLRADERFKDYSYAFYSDGRLLSQSGSFDYDVVNTDFKGKLKQYLFKSTNSNYSEGADISLVQKLTRYNHLIYQPSLRKVIVVSKPENSLLSNIASLTFFFVVLLLFSAVIIIAAWVWKRITFVKITAQSIRWDFKLNFESPLYKTRIQFSIMLAVVVTLALVGFITYWSIKAQYLEQQDQMMGNKANNIATKFESFFSGGIQRADERTQIRFNNFADNFSADLVYFNKSGVPIISTQPKIYEYGLLGRRMHASAYIMLSRRQKSLLINNEKIAKLSYKTAYVPIRNAQNITIGYLQVPYFSNEADYYERINSFVNSLINIYAFIFVAIGIFAVLVARQITTPLNFIQESLRRTIYGKKNEPIKWERNDEIGALVKEYNNMIAALENSANKLAQSERESAWREMAKQVAHEIKNPLTPLKLGLQLLEKSWKDKDPRFDAKFERFSKSFVEQIESLSSIASEFSAFAKMPDTKMVRLDLFETLGQAVIIFKHMDNLRISYEPPAEPFMINADRDQLLRCFNNLLKNAIEAMPPERFGLVDIFYDITDNHILLRIHDNGNGIPENLRERIFEPNFTTKSSGTGLGLAFVKNSIENAGGKVWYETELNQGTTFYLQFPQIEDKAR
ncbi:sensor histidine kinase [Mucilaginibacter terrae]|uniref:histidine kinase n=1 Tax=Mucilaginibacter terrae TaxID=1955052 RepID=A0ABU3GUW2_9SPHI|nr:ATP-binding protein [Mucilaginibacter terrae]MDT3403558.1 two-component system nitrogen regulation sensor histidine kinase NtrY [Mucilaginibacter terrae]